MVQTSPAPTAETPSTPAQAAAPAPAAEPPAAGQTSVDRSPSPAARHAPAAGEAPAAGGAGRAGRAASRGAEAPTRRRRRREAASSPGSRRPDLQRPAGFGTATPAGIRDSNGRWAAPAGAAHHAPPRRRRRIKGEDVSDNVDDDDREQPKASRPTTCEAGTTVGLEDAVVQARGVERDYGKGDAAVHALARRRHRHPAGRAHGHHGPVRLRQVARSCTSSPASTSPPAAASGIDGVEITRLKEKNADAAAPRQDRLHLPELQPAADADRRREHRPAAHARRPQGRRGLAAHRHRGRRPAGPPDAPPGRALRRPAAARRRRPRAASPGRPCSSPTSPPATSTRAPAEEVLRPAPPLASTSSARPSIMVTHDANAASIADRVVFLKDGAHRAATEDRMTRDDIYDIIKNLEVTPMTRLACRSLTSRPAPDRPHHRWRSCSGVAMISGTYVLTDQIDNGFEQHLHRRRTRAPTSGDAEDGVHRRQMTGATDGLPRAMVAQVQAVAGRRQGRRHVPDAGRRRSWTARSSRPAAPRRCSSPRNPGRPSARPDYVAGRAAQAAGRGRHHQELRRQDKDLKPGDSFDVVRPAGLQHGQGRRRLHVRGDSARWAAPSSSPAACRTCSAGAAAGQLSGVSIAADAGRHRRARSPRASRPRCRRTASVKTGDAGGRRRDQARQRRHRHAS